MLARAIEEADGLGYRPRVEVFTILLHTLPWQRKPGIDELAALWREEFPACTQPAAGLTEVLDQLRQMEIRLGIVTNGRTSMQLAKIRELGIERQMARSLLHPQANRRRRRELRKRQKKESPPVSPAA